jgi:GNAT superfamily N-acetyltransferase
MDNLAHMGMPSGLIEDVVVKPEWQGKGIGKRMMQYALERCREYSCYKVVKQ